MKNATLVTMLFAVGLFTGCASQPSTGAAHGDPWVDQDRVAAVEREAKRAGVEVRWVNPPAVRERRS